MANYRLGFFRLWVVATVIYAMAVAAISYAGVRKEFERASIDRSVVWDIPVICDEARGTEALDYKKYDNTKNVCWYEQPNFRKLFPEYNDLSNEDVSMKTYAKAGLTWPLAQPWHFVGNVALIATVPPIAILVLGFALSWAFAGFALTRK